MEAVSEGTQLSNHSNPKKIYLGPLVIMMMRMMIIPAGGEKDEHCAVWALGELGRTRRDVDYDSPTARGVGRYLSCLASACGGHTHMLAIKYEFRPSYSLAAVGREHTHACCAHVRVGVLLLICCAERTLLLVAQRAARRGAV